MADEAPRPVSDIQLEMYLSMDGYRKSYDGNLGPYGNGCTPQTGRWLLDNG